MEDLYNQLQDTIKHRFPKLKLSINLKLINLDLSWEELSDNERRVVEIIAGTDESISAMQIKEKLAMDSNNFSTYRDTLIKSGLVINTAYGKIDLALPFFREYVREYYL